MQLAKKRKRESFQELHEDMNQVYQNMQDFWHATPQRNNNLETDEIRRSDRSQQPPNFNGLDQRARNNQERHHHCSKRKVSCEWPLLRCRSVKGGNNSARFWQLACQCKQSRAKKHAFTNKISQHKILPSIETSQQGFNLNRTSETSRYAQELRKW